MSTSQQTIRRLIANQIEPGRWAPVVTTASGPAGVATCSSFSMSGGDVRSLDGGWFYFCDGTLAGQERAIAEAGLGIAGGDISVGNPFTATTPSGANGEVHLTYPVTETVGGTPLAGSGSYREMINNSARWIWFEDDLSVSAVSGQVRYLIDITTYPWLADRPKDRILDVIAPADTTTGVRYPTKQAWDIDDDAEAPALILHGGGYATGETFYLKVARPCNTRVKINGVWTDLTPSSLNNGVYGVYADTDEIHAIANHILALAITESMNQLGMRAPVMAEARWEQRRGYWARVAAAIKYARLPRKNDGRVRLSMASVGGGVMSGRGSRVKTWGGGW